MSETPEPDRTREVIDRISLGLGDEYAQELTRDIFTRGIGLVIGLSLISMDFEDEPLMAGEEISGPEEQ